MERVPKLGVGVTLTAAIILLAGCANLQTVNRESRVPLASGKGRAIHLDAQQRMVVFAAERFCAEPSPDALAAYASALGLGASHGSKSAANAATSLNSVAGSIGLRTQSITLMRDTLYRTCEAAMNGSLSDEQVAMLVARSQDLTAVVLAIEQLTGTVAAPPITLTPGASASSASMLLASTEALNAVREAVGKAETERNAAEKRKDEMATELTAATKARLQAYELYKATPGDVALEKTYKDSITTESQVAAAADQARRDFESKDSAYNEFKKTEQRISAAHDSSSTAVSSSVTSGASLGSFVYHSNLNEKVGTEIAEQVGHMVRRLLHKDYFTEACMATIMRPSDERQAKMALASNDSAPARDPTNASFVKMRAQEVLRDIDESRNKLVQKCMDYFTKFEPSLPNDPFLKTKEERGSQEAFNTSETETPTGADKPKDGKSE